jgi:BASS family bile acid:Na+ symporter
MQELDNVKINFDTNGLWILNLALAVVMFGVALGVTLNDFKQLSRQPKLILLGILSQFLLLPFVTYLFVILIKPQVSIALGMMMVAACPGGNISNFMTHLAKGNTALSVSLTAFATFLAMLMTPLNFQFYGNLYEPTALLLESVELNFFELVKLVLLILGVPLVIGMAFRSKNEKLAEKLSKILKPISIIIFVAIVILAFYKNLDIFYEYIHRVFLIGISHNLIALALGFGVAKYFGF